MPDATAEAILKALSKKPENRFTSIGEFVSALGKSQSYAPEESTPSTASWHRRDGSWNS
jgi:hypothetical protein